MQFKQNDIGEDVYRIITGLGVPPRGALTSLSTTRLWFIHFVLGPQEFVVDKGVRAPCGGAPRPPNNFFIYQLIFFIHQPVQVPCSLRSVYTQLWTAKCSALEALICYLD